MHEIEGHYFERNFIKDILNWTKSAISRKIHIWPTDNLDKSRTWQHRICSLMPLGFLKQILASTLSAEGDIAISSPLSQIAALLSLPY